MLGLRPWFAFLRRRFAFFLLVRFDIGPTRYRLATPRSQASASAAMRSSP